MLQPAIILPPLLSTFTANSGMPEATMKSQRMGKTAAVHNTVAINEN